jgi:hypothetical protein
MTPLPSPSSARGLPNAGIASNRDAIPTYAANGVRLRNRSLASIETCLHLTPPRVVVKRNKRTGRITSAQFMPLPRDSSAVDGKEEVRSRAPLGQRYSFRDAAINHGGHRPWRFCEFPTPGDMRRDPFVEPADIEAWHQAMFRAVPLSCLAKETYEAA